MERKGSGSYDPGWNDPPLFSYESQSAQSRSSKPRNLLTKRVAFPLNESPPINRIPIDPTAPLTSCQKFNLPPPPSVGLPVASTLEIPKMESSEDVEVFNSSEVLLTVMNNLCDVLNTKFENQIKDKTEIQRRLDTMKSMWIDDKLCQNIQQKLLELSEALKDNEIEKADELQKGLMVDHAPACSQWMSGVRHLIHRKELRLTNNDKEER